MIAGDDVTRILLEVTLGKAPATPDTPEQAAFRAEVALEVEEMGAQGIVIDIPSD